MVKGKIKKNKNTNDKNTIKGCLNWVGGLLLVIIIVYTCSDEENDTNVEKQYVKYNLKSSSILDEVHGKIFNNYDERGIIPEYDLNTISEIHQYLNIERWNTGGDIGRRWGTNYEKAAEDLDITVSKLKAADNYFHYHFQPELTNIIKVFFNEHPNIILDYYYPLKPTAYCGFYTIIGGVSITGQKSNTDFKTEAKNVVITFANNLPEWITGFKLHYTIYKDEILETDGDVDIGFLWRKGEDILIMHGIRGTIGLCIPTQCTHWHNDEWNDLKYIEHPSYNYIEP